MLELSINPTAIVCIFLIILATYANLANDMRSSILGMLCAVMLLCALSSGSNSILIIIIGIVYVSILSLFLTMSQNTNRPKWKLPKYAWLGLITLATAILISSNPYLTFINLATTYSGIADVTLLLFSIALIVLSLLISFLRL